MRTERYVLGSQFAISFLHAFRTKHLRLNPYQDAAAPQLAVVVKDVRIFYLPRE